MSDWLTKVHLTPQTFFSLKRIYFLFEILLRKLFWFELILDVLCPDEISKIAPKHLHFCCMTESEENGSSSCCDVYPGRSNISRPLISLRIKQYIFEKCAETPSRGAIGCCSNNPDLKKDIPYSLLAMIGQLYNKNVNYRTSELTPWEPLKNLTLSGICSHRLSNAILKNFCRKTVSNL